MKLQPRTQTKTSLLQWSSQLQIQTLLLFGGGQPTISLHMALLHTAASANWMCPADFWCHYFPCRSCFHPPGICMLGVDGLCKYVYVYVCECAKYVCVCLCMFTHTHTHTHTCTYVYRHTYTHTQKYTYILEGIFAYKTNKYASIRTYVYS